MKESKKYPVIEVPASGVSGMMGGAWCYYFMYTKHHGNFILKGYAKEIDEYIEKKGYTHWVANISLFLEGTCRFSHWKFWKDDVGIFSPVKWRGKKWESKYTMRRYFRMYEERDPNALTLKFKRMPHRWIPEFDQF